MAEIRIHYLDASAIVKLLVEEDGSLEVRRYLERHANHLTTSLCFAESLGVLKSKHLHKRLSTDGYLAACEELIALVRHKNLIVEDIGITDWGVFNEVERLVKIHSIDLSDAFQLLTIRTGSISKLQLNSSPIFVTADKSLALAARKEGLIVWDCMNETAP